MCIICGDPSERCHIKSRGSGGGDEEWNIMHLCREHHIEQHKRGWLGFSSVYPVAREELQRKGWEFLGWGKLVRR